MQQLFGPFLVLGSPQKSCTREPELRPPEHTTSDLPMAPAIFRFVPCLAEINCFAFTLQPAVQVRDVLHQPKMD
ncbi:uncharacterized protein PITG_17044 [Phytophthora infestans T30-4]|uniref:Uncharacterized protein n=1 Tax=Phytophthora infestans (strain T30-4) TaxID=403677 RepID=D0NUN9_PHYIT|nr:uncharacterized protein PITG_17044 [Phytophthora infestans T30-4]EEY65385.1 hypothetical protein PITG_17044 [Phytophthora infestans T30-4]|eukprot:XP_002897248.1 hypothetical protein PITG_17044 [Phytophthora infestans T30-4]